MEPPRGESKDIQKPRAKLSCSFSIERILKQDDKKNTPKDLNDENENQINFKDNYTEKGLTNNEYPSLSRSPSPSGSFQRCPHPICPVPTARMVHPDSFYGYYLQRSVPSCCSLSSMHKGPIDRSYLPNSSDLAYADQTYRYVREKGNFIYFDYPRAYPFTKRLQEIFQC